MTNKTEFKVALIRANLTMDELAEAVGMSSASLSYKVNNKREFTSTEIKSISERLDLSIEDRELIFFAETVDC